MTMGHGETLLANARNAEQREMIERQRSTNMPKLFNGYIKAMSIDTAYELSGHEPRLTKLRPQEFRHGYNTPVSAHMFNPDAFLNYSNSFDDMRHLTDIIRKDLKKLKCCVALETDMPPPGADGVQKYRSYIALPHIKTGGTEDAPQFRKDMEETAKFIGYMMAKFHEDRPGHAVTLATPREMIDAFGYGLVVEALKKENVRALRDAVALDPEKRLKEAVRSDPETGARLMTYMMAHKQILPEAVEQKFGHEILMKSCSRENVDWFRSLRGLPSAPLEDEMPRAAKYLADSGPKGLKPAM